RKWPKLAIRRFLLYDVLLHEIGHLQVYDERRPSRRLRFYREKLAQEFADCWRPGYGLFTSITLILSTTRPGKVGPIYLYFRVFNVFRGRSTEYAEHTEGNVRDAVDLTPFRPL